MIKISPFPAETPIEPEPLTEDQVDEVSGGRLFPWGEGGCQACCSGIDPVLLSKLAGVVDPGV
jgi:hypothetical protein